MGNTKSEFWWIDNERKKKAKNGWTELSKKGWYNTREWKTLRKLALSQNPLCVLCEEEGKLIPAKEVNHITPAEKDKSKFFDLANLQPLCSYHHRVITRRDNSKYSPDNLKRGEKLRKQFESE